MLNHLNVQKTLGYNTAAISRLKSTSIIANDPATKITIKSVTSVACIVSCFVGRVTLSNSSRQSCKKALPLAIGEECCFDDAVIFALPLSAKSASVSTTLPPTLPKLFAGQIVAGWKSSKIICQEQTRTIKKYILFCFQFVLLAKSAQSLFFFYKMPPVLEHMAGNFDGFRVVTE